MPTSSGQFQLQDYLAELQNRGFDGFTAADLTTYINRGYFHVASKSQWMWEQTTQALTIAPGASYALLSAITNFRSLDKLVVTTAGQTRVLKPMTDERFYSYLAKDLTLATYRSEPMGYYIYQNRLYVLPPPATSRDFLAYYHQRVNPLVLVTDVPLTPQHLDEAIILASLIRCHRRANEPTLAALVEQDLDEFFDNMRDDESELMEEYQDRVKPDNTWL